MTSPLQQKIKVTGPVVVTANRLTDGAVIYRATNGQWTTELPGAAVVTTSDAAMALLAVARADAVRVVDVYVAPVVLADGKPRPGNLRERIRAAGPTIRLPVQAEASNVHVCA
jgi:Protein of unknown function (DUF2849)